MIIKIHPDGTLEFPEGIPTGMLFKFHVPSGNLMIPKHPCSNRIGLCVMSPCGKRPVFKFKCTHFKRKVTLLDCGGCDARQEQGQGCPMG